MPVADETTPLVEVRTAAAGWGNLGFVEGKKEGLLF